MEVPTGRLAMWWVLASETVVFGEKRNQSPHYYMDFLEGIGNDVTEVEQS